MSATFVQRFVRGTHITDITRYNIWKRDREADPAPLRSARTGPLSLPAIPSIFRFCSQNEDDRQSNLLHLATAPCSVKAAQNEARNDIIRHGKLSGARWILAFDGNQFYTMEAWRAITSAAIRYEEVGLKYFKV